MFKVLKYNQPEYLVQCLTPYFTESILNLRSSDDPHRLSEPIAINGHNFNLRSFTFVAPRLYNLLPISLKDMNSIEPFKKGLKTFLFAKAYDTTQEIVKTQYVV